MNLLFWKRPPIPKWIKEGAHIKVCNKCGNLNRQSGLSKRKLLELSKKNKATLPVRCVFCKARINMRCLKKAVVTPVKD